MVAYLSQAGQPVAELAAADGVALPGPSAACVRQAMGALRKCTDAATAEQVCQSLQPCPVIVSNMALQVCVSRDLATARRLFAGTAGKDVITYNTLLKGEAQAGAWDAVRKLLAEMTERVTPNHVTFNTLLHACVAQKASPWAFVTAMEQQGLAPDAITVTTLLRAVAGPADAAHLRRCLTYVEAVSGTDDALFDACSRARARDLLASALDMAQRAGVQTERAFVNLLRTAASLEEAWSLWKDLASPASPEYSQMAQTLTQLGALEDARDLCAQARQSGHMVNASASAQLIKALCARKDVASASAVSEQLMT